MNLSVEATVFCPTVGLQVDALVTVCKPKYMVCRYGDTFSIFISVSLQGPDAEPLPNDPETGNPIPVFQRDVVRVEISRITTTAAGDAVRLKGRVISVLSRGYLGKRHLGLHNDIEESKAEVEDEEHLQKKKKKKRDISQVEGQSESPVMKKKKKKSKKHQDEEDDFEEEGEGGDYAPRLTKPEPTPLGASEKLISKKHKSKRHSEVDRIGEESAEILPTAIANPKQSNTVLEKPTSSKRKSKHQTTIEHEGKVDEERVEAPERVHDKRKKKSSKSHLEVPSIVKMDPDATVLTHSQRSHEEITKKSKKHRDVDPIGNDGEIENEIPIRPPVPLKRDPSEIEQHRNSKPAREPSPEIFSSSSSDSESSEQAEARIIANALKWEER